MRKILLTLCAALVAASSYAQWGPVNAVYLQGRMVCSTAPSNGQSLIWNTTYNCWTPTTATGGITASDDVAWTGTHTFSLGATFGAASQLKWGSSGVTSPDVGFRRLLTTWLQVTDGSTGTGSLSLRHLNVLRVDDNDYGMILFGGTVGNEFANDTYLGRPVAGRIDIQDAVGLGALAIDGLSIGATSTLADGKLSMTSVLNDATGNETALSLAYTTNKGTSGDDTGLQIVQTDTASPGTSYLINAKVGSTSYFSVVNAGGYDITTVPSLLVAGSFRAADSGGTGGSTPFLDVSNNGSKSGYLTLVADGRIAWTASEYYNDTKDIGLARSAAGVLKVTNGSTGAGTITAGGLQTGLYTAVTDGKAIINGTLDDATGDEVAAKIAYTTNKATSGADTGLEIVQTDTASPGTSYLINAKVGSTSKFSVDNIGMLDAQTMRVPFNGYIYFGSGAYTEAIAPSTIRVSGGTLFIRASSTIDVASGAQIKFDSGTDSVTSQDVGFTRSSTGVVKVTDGSTGAGTLTADGIQTGAYTAVADGKAIFNTTLNDATGDENSLSIVQTTNKASSGNDTAIRVDFTDTASPGSSYLLQGYYGSDRQYNATWGSYPGFTVKATGSGDKRSAVAAENNSGKYIQLFANGTGATAGIVADDTGIYYAANDNRGIPILSSQTGAFDYGWTVQAGVKLGEQGGSSAVDAGIRRAAAGVVQAFNGNAASPSAATMAADGIVTGGTTAVADGKAVINATLNDATGNEVAVQINGTTNKASSGNDTMLEIVQTDTASPGTSYLIDAKVGSQSRFSVSPATAPRINLGGEQYASTNYGATWAVDLTGTLAGFAALQGGSTTATTGVSGRDLSVVSDASNLATRTFLFTGTTMSVRGDAEIIFTNGTSGTADPDNVGLMRGAVSENTLVITDGSTGYGLVKLDANNRLHADTVSLTDGSDVAFLDIAIAAGEMMGGSISYTITATDATDFQAIAGTVSFAAVRKSTTYVCDIDEHLGTDSTAVSTGTLTDTFSCAGASDKITLTINSNSSLTTPTMTMRYEARLQTLNTITKK